MVGVPSCGDKLSHPPANGESPQNTSYLVVLQDGLPELSLTSRKPQCVTKQIWKHQPCVSCATSFVSQNIFPISSG